jgi:hypothetical protein
MGLDLPANQTGVNLTEALKKILLRKRKEILKHIKKMIS